MKERPYKLFLDDRLVSEHETRELAEKRMKRLISMSRGSKKGTPSVSRDRFAIDIESVRPRGKNPRMQNMFVLLATKGKTVLKYVGGVRFSTKGRAVLFPSRQAANMAARDLRSRFPVLKGYTLRVQS